MVFASIYTLDSGDYGELQAAVNRLTLNDPSVTIHPCMSQVRFASSSTAAAPFPTPLTPPFLPPSLAAARSACVAPRPPRRSSVAPLAGECSLFTVTFYANHAHNLTRSP